MQRGPTAGQVFALGPGWAAAAGHLAARRPGIARAGHRWAASGVVFMVRTGELAAGSRACLAAAAGRHSYGQHGSEDARMRRPAVVAMHAELDVADTASVAATVAVRERVVIVDLAGLEFIESSLAALVLARKPGKPAETCCSPCGRTRCGGFMRPPAWPVSSPFQRPAGGWQRRALPAGGCAGVVALARRDELAARRHAAVNPTLPGEVTTVTFGRRPEGRERDRRVSCTEGPGRRPDGLALLRKARNAARTRPCRRGPVRWAGG
jgi:hypothetical protein